MKKREYRIEEAGYIFNRIEPVEKKCNQLGENGWRLVSTSISIGNTIIMFFEREKVEEKDDREY